MIETWLRGYLKAWASDDPSDVTALFTEDARYYTEPYSKPWEGSDRIAREWIARGDANEKWTFEHEVVAETADAAVVRGITRYAPRPADQPQRLTSGQTYHNVWLVRFAPDGRAREFTEWWMQEK